MTNNSENKSDLNKLSPDQQPVYHTTVVQKAEMSPKKYNLILISVFAVLLLLIIGGILLLHHNSGHYHQTIEQQTEVRQNAAHAVQSKMTDKDMKSWARYHSLRLLYQKQVNYMISGNAAQQTKINQYDDGAKYSLGDINTMLYIYQLPYSNKVALLFYDKDTGDLLNNKNMTADKLDLNFWNLQADLMKGMSKYDQGEANGNAVNKLIIKYRHY